MTRASGKEQEELFDAAASPTERRDRLERGALVLRAKGDFVVKLPRRRVDELEAAGAGKRFAAFKGSPMKEWLALDATSNQDWTELAREALSFWRTVL